MPRLEAREDGIFLDGRRLDGDTMLERQVDDEWVLERVRPLRPATGGLWRVGWEGVGAIPPSGTAPVASDPMGWELRWPAAASKVYVAGKGMVDYVNDEECKELAASYSRKMKASGGAPHVLQQIADDLSKERLTDEKFEAVVRLIAQMEIPIAPPGGQVIVIGGPSREVDFVVGLARSMRGVRPPL